MNATALQGGVRCSVSQPLTVTDAEFDTCRCSCIKKARQELAPRLQRLLNPFDAKALLRRPQMIAAQLPLWAYININRNLVVVADGRIGAELAVLTLAYFLESNVKEFSRCIDVGR